MKKATLIFLSGITFVCSCRQQDQAKKYLLIPVAEKQAEAVQKHKYYYTIKNTTSFTASGGNVDIEGENTAETGIISEILPPDSAGNKRIKYSFDKLHAETAKNDEKEIYDADNAAESGETMDKVFNSIKGSSILITMDAKGNVINTTGSKEITDKVLAGLTTYDAAEKSIIAERLKKIAGDDFLKENFEQMYKLLPDTAVHAGSTWTAATEVPGEVTLKSLTTYTLEDIDGSIADISFKADIKSGEQATLSIMGSNINAAISGTQKGNMQVDVKQGRIVSAASKINIAGNVSGAMKNIPVKIAITRTMKSKEL